MKFEIDPYSELAGVCCQVAADAAVCCGYADCDEPAVGAAVHGGPGNRRERPWTEFVPVCERHKGWELAKLEIMETGQSPVYL